MKTFALILLVCLQLVSCGKLDFFEKTAMLPEHKWFYNNKPAFTFDITDTSSLYSIFIVLRHTDAYNYNNIWLNIGSGFPGEAIQYKNIDITLGSDANGWEGNGMDDIYELRKNITAGPVAFKKSGSYTFIISQIMREDPLKDILNVGIRVEKVKM